MSSTSSEDPESVQIRVKSPSHSHDRNRNREKYKAVLYFLHNVGLDVLEEEMTVGPKGQVVIPRAMRKVLKIEPGSKVVFRLEDGRAIVQKQEFDAVRTLEGVAKRGKSIRRIQPHQYETELAERA